MSSDIDGMSGNNKRKSPRLEECDKVTVTVLSSPEAPEIEDKQFHCWTKDLSEGGLKFKVHTHVPIGAIVNVDVLFLSDGANFTHIGRVMWEREFDEEGLIASELGIKFTKIVGEAGVLEEWKRLIKSKLEEAARRAGSGDQ